MKKVTIQAINFYQKHLSFHTKNSCVFLPSCSEYTKEAINKYGITKGIRLGFVRILRCHPWQKKHIDLLK
jgi:putative membrane protein insertion efficiency factor